MKINKIKEDKVLEKPRSSKSLINFYQYKDVFLSSYANQYYNK